MNATKDDTRFLSAVFTGLLCLFSRTAHAAPDAARDPEVEQMAGLLQQSAISARDTRLAIAVTQITGGVAFLPAGIVLSTRKDPVSQSIGIGMAVGGGVPLLFSALSLLPSKMEGLRDHFEDRRASNMATDDLLRVTEDEWREAANASHNVRLITGYITLSVGSASTAFGLGLLLAKPGFAGLDRNGQYTVGSLLVGPGMPLITAGVFSLFQRTPEESS
ncbi:MAG TPA: hypothetical protein VNW92_11630, partial [Polyangiaceae bacterium]|nr:hypothetical protein [Polyangiaceae bacterium]